MQNSTQTRAINWLESTTQSLANRCPETRGCARYLTENLCRLLLERLEQQTAGVMMELLPEEMSDDVISLRRSAEGSANASIGYPDFVKRAEEAIACSAMRGPRREDLSEYVVDAFLWAIAQELPPEMKSRMAEELPSELRSRMNLYSAQSDDAKVA